MGHNYNIHEFRDVTSHTDLPAHLVSGIEECVASAFGGGITQEDARHHMAGGQVLVAANDTHIGGFTSTSIISPRDEFGDDSFTREIGGYFAGAAISSETQGSGLYRRLNTARMAFALGSGVEFIFTRTQNPRVEEGITHSLDELVEAGVIEAHEIDRRVVEGAYGKMLTSTRPHARSTEYGIDYDRGDALVLSWKLKR